MADLGKASDLAGFQHDRERQDLADTGDAHQGGELGGELDLGEHLPTVGKFEINNVTAKLTGSVLVARFDLTVTAVTNGVPQSTTPAPRLSTFVRDHGRWQLAAYANFNTPAPTNG